MERNDRNTLLVVIDTNVLVSYFWGGSTIGRIMEGLWSRRYKAAVSEPMLAEIEMVCTRPKFSDRISRELLHEISSAYRRAALMVVPQRILRLSVDAKDNMFLECAVECGADYLISGDDHLLRLGSVHGTMIVNAASFAKMVL